LDPRCGGERVMGDRLSLGKAPEMGEQLGSAQCETRLAEASECRVRRDLGVLVSSSFTQ